MRLIVGLAALFVFIGGIAGAYYFIPRSDWYKNYTAVKIRYKGKGEKPAMTTVTSKLDGITVSVPEGSDPDLIANPLIVAVMVDNHPDARPQSGLAAANVVYEIPAEGGITRFMAIFDYNTMPQAVGPVRSARPYYMDYLTEWGTPLYAHVGGSPDALEKLKSPAFNDLNEFFEANYFLRDRSRYAPHNTYTGHDYLTPLVPERVTSTAYTGLVFSSSTVLTAKPAGENVDILFAQGGHRVRWIWNSKLNKYERMQAGAIHRDKNGDSIMADTVVVQEVPAQVVDSEGRLEMQTTGTGKAWVLRGGKKIEGTWKKSTKMARTLFVDSSGKPIEFAPGKIWFEVVQPQSTVTF